MTPAQYHGILTSLTDAERRFEASSNEWSAEDRELYQALRVIRSEVLKRESGHPFPNAGLGRAMARLTQTEVSAAAETDQDASAKTAPRRTRVLLVDDETSVRTIVRLMLTATTDMEVVAEARNGRDAVEAAIICRPDVVVMDLNMPILDGMEAARCITRVHPWQRIIIFTANRAPRCIEQAVEVGAVGFITKPAGKDELLAMIRNAQAGKRFLGELQALNPTSEQDFA